MVAKVQECRYSDDGSTINVNGKDVEETLKSVIIPKRNWKFFDRYCYSVLTDDLPVEDKVVNATTLKAGDIVSFRKSRLNGNVDVDNLEFKGVKSYAKKKY